MSLAPLVSLEAMSSCGSCYGPGRDRQPVDSSLLSLFDVSPLGDVDPEAGSQEGHFEHN